MKYDNTNKIVLFKNNKQKETWPDLKGKVNVEGVDYSVSLWTRKSKKDDSTFWSGEISKQEAYKKEEQSKQESSDISNIDDIDLW